VHRPLAFVLGLVLAHIAHPRADLGEALPWAKVAAIARVAEEPSAGPSREWPVRVRFEILRDFGCGERLAPGAPVTAALDEHGEEYRKGEKVLVLLGEAAGSPEPLADLLVRGEKVPMEETPDGAAVAFLEAACASRKGGAPMAPEIVAAAAGSKVPRVAASALHKMLILKNDRRAHPALLAAGKDPAVPASARITLAGALAQTRTTAEIAAVGEESTEPAVRAAWFAAAGEARGEPGPAVSILTAALAKGSDAERVAAARSLALLGSDAGREVLEGARAAGTQEQRDWAKDGLDTLARRRVDAWRPRLLSLFVAGCILLALWLSRTRRQRRAQH
jgi:hypothetical protein